MDGNGQRLINPRTAFVIQQVADRFRNPEKSTLEYILENPAITGYASGDDLTRAQKGLVATTVSLMQDQLIQQLRDNADDLRASLEDHRVVLKVFRELPLAIGRMYCVPMFGRTPDSDEKPKPKRKWLDILNWGNFAALGGIAIFVVALFYTKAYASYKDRADSLEKSLSEVTGHSKAMHEEKVSLAGQLATQMERTTEAAQDRDLWKATAELRQKAIDEKVQELAAQAAKIDVEKDAATVKAELDDAKAQVQKLTDELATDRAKLASFRQEVQGMQEQRTVFKNLFEKEQRDSGDRLAMTERLQRELGDAKSKADKYVTQLRAYKIPVPQ